tara:strand:- start:2128 stop:2688 length:561 start_codon:yes stop_codon:yes gene_type:complete
MHIKNILILGSTLLTEKAIDMMRHRYNLIGHIPSKKPTVEGNIRLPIVDMDVDYDIALSIQYDRIIKNPVNCFNVHTGLLPKYGGTNILDYSIKNKEKEQGITLHKMTDKLDFGPIISKSTYPVLEGDTAYDLYKRLLCIGPNFVFASLELLQELSEEQIEECYTEKPTIYKRGEFKINKKMSTLK